MAGVTVGAVVPPGGGEMKRYTRILRHAWLDATDSNRALPPDAATRLAQWVAQSECRHTGEIRVCVEAGLPLHMLWPVPDDAALSGVIRQRAREWFGRLGVWDTEQNNGVLIYVLLAERAIEIVADRGLDRHISPEAWQTHMATLTDAFRRGEFEQGLSAVIQEVGVLLERHFPAQPGQANKNELPDAIVLC